MSRRTTKRQIDEYGITTSTMSQKKSKDEFNFNDFPEEIIISIFSHLKLSERKTARLVCKRWHHISYTFRLIRNDVTVLNKNFNLMKTPSSSSQHINIRLGAVFYVNPDAYTENFSMLCNSSFWVNHCRNMRSIEITVTSYDIIKFLSKILFFCPDIEQITLYNEVLTWDIPCWPTPKLFPERVQLQNLRSLKLSGFSDVMFPMLKFALMKAPKLVSIYVDIERFFYTPGEGPPILNLDFRPASNLEDIYLSGDIINYRFLADIKGIFSEKLKQLTLNMCTLNKVSLTDLEFIAGRCLNLKQLVLNGIRCDVSRYNVPFLSSNSLTCITLGSQMNLTDDVVASLAVLKNLARLDLFFSPNLTHKGIDEIFGKRVRPEMLDLRMDNMPESSNYHNIIIKMLPNLPNLKVLSLGKLKLTRQLLETLMTHNTSLESLTLKGTYYKNPPYALLSKNIMTKLMYLDIYETNLPRDFVESLELPSLKLIYCKFSSFQPKKGSSSIRVEGSPYFTFDIILSNYNMGNHKGCHSCCKS